MDTTPVPDVEPAEELGDAQISEIVDQEVAAAVADADSVYVVSMEFQGDSYTSVHTSRDGADARLRETTARWGITEGPDADQLVATITKVPLETP